MRLGFWKKHERKNPFTASLILDNPDIKIVEARYNENPVFFGVGTSKQREKEIAAGVSTEGTGGKYAIQKELEWRMYYNKDNMPTGFIPIEKLEDWMKGTTAVVSGSMSAYGTTSQNFKPIEREDYERTEKTLSFLSNQTAEERIQEIREEVEKVLDRLGQITAEDEDSHKEKKSSEQE